MKKGKQTDAEVSVKELADAILNEHHFAQDGTGLFVFRNGVYQPGGEEFVKALMLACSCSEKWTSHKASEVVEFIRVDAPQLWTKPPVNTVNLRNGLLDVETRTLRPHSSEFLSPIQLPIEYDAEATCPAWDQFISTSFPADTRELTFEVIAWLMTPDTSIQKAVLALGEGSNGKSTWITAIIAFLGKKNVAGLSLQKLEKDRFALSRLVGKLANICPDLPSAHLSDTGTFKALTGTEAQLTAEVKFKTSFEFEPFARLLFSANQPPRSNDATHAFFRRWLVVPFERTFEEGTEFTPIPRNVLDARLAHPKELSGVLNKALAVLPRVRANGITETPSMLAAWQQFRQETDPLAVWLDTATIEQPDGVISKRQLHRAYAEQCARRGLPDPGSNAFGRSVKRLRPALAEKQRMIDGKLEWAWIGIAFRGNDEPAPSSLNSRNSRDSANLNLSSAQAEEPQIEIDINRGNPVNCVKLVKLPPYSEEVIPHPAEPGHQAPATDEHSSRKHAPPEPGNLLPPDLRELARAFDAGLLPGEGADVLVDGVLVRDFAGLVGTRLQWLREAIQTGDRQAVETWEEYLRPFASVWQKMQAQERVTV